MAWHTVPTILIGVPLVFIAWGVGMLGLTFLQPAGQPVAVMASGGMADALDAVVAADGYILQVKGNTVIAVSDGAGFVARLYREGALIVMAASPGGCLVAPGGSSVVRGPAVLAPEPSV